MLLDLAVDGSAFDIRSADFGGIAADEENFVEGDVLAFFRVELFNEDLVADRNFHLFAAGFNNCVLFHVFPPCLLYGFTRYGGLSQCSIKAFSKRLHA